MPDPAPPVATPVHIPSDDTLVEAAHTFLESWLVRKDYDMAFTYVSPRAYACYDIVRGPDQPAAASLDDAGKRIREALERAGSEFGDVRALDDMIGAVQPVHPAVRVMDHRYSSTFALASVPNAIAAAVDCAVRSRGEQFTGEVPLEYGNAFGAAVRFRTRAGEPPVLRMLWAKESGSWRIVAYDLETP